MFILHPQEYWRKITRVSLMRREGIDSFETRGTDRFVAKVAHESIGGYSY
jgi:hypothetical protein